MIVLHAGWHEGRLLLWGETLQDAAPTTTPRRGRKPKQPTDAPSPFDAGEARLSTAIKSVPWPTPPTTPERVILWSPTVNHRPVASSPLIAPPPPGADATLTVVPWTVTALQLTTVEALDLLTACLDRETLAPGILLGSTLTFWTHALRFAAGLAAREQFIPGVRRVGSDWVASWSPVLAGAEAERSTKLTKAMPAACRALTRAADTAPARPAAAVLEEFLTATVDALVRSGRGSVTNNRSVITRPRRHSKPQSFDSLHDQWLHALAAADGKLTGSATELAGLAEQITAWQKPALGVSLAPFRLCFRLEEPPPDGDEITADGDWQVRYLLQARDDPSLFIPVADTWSPTGRVAGVFQKRSFKPREYLLAALGQASSLCAPVEASLKTATPAGFRADTTGACDFLGQHAWLLEQAGFGVLLPSWWTPGGRPKLTVRAQVKKPPQLTGGGMTLEELIRFDWQTALGDQLLTLKELETLAKLKQPLVRVRGQWVEVRPEELHAVLELWKKKEAGQATVRDVLRMALGTAEAPGGLEISGVDAEDWLGELLDKLQGRTTLTDLAPPAGMQATLRPYQVHGYSWLAFLKQWGLGACLADDMGLGKTVQALAFIQREREAGQFKPVLLICPTSVLGNWSREAARFTPDLPAMIHHGAQRHKASAFARQVASQALILTSYALLVRDIELLKKIDWAGVVLDEAQNIKNPQTKQAKAARDLQGGYRFALTGTPVENHVGDLWSIMEFLNPGFLGNQADFRRRFFIPIQLEHNPNATGRLKKLTGPFVLRRLKTDKSVIPDLPEKVEMKVFCTLTQEQASLYAAVVKEATKALEDADGIKRKGLVLALLTKLKQVCNHPAHFLGDHSSLPDRSGKLNRLTELLDELFQVGEKALLFTQFTEMGELLKSYLQETFGREVLFLHGGVTRKNRDGLVERFQSPDGPRLFVLSLKAGGTGLNLTAAAQVIHFDRWWNPAVENQATDRAFRIGQTRNVLVHKFVCSGTLEDKIDEMIERKQVVAGKVVGTGEGWLTEMSNEQLADLVALRREALGD